MLDLTHEVNSVKSEFNTIACFLIDPTLLDITRIESIHYNDRECKEIFQAMEKLLRKSQQVDVMTLATMEWINEDRLFDLSMSINTTSIFETAEKQQIDSYNKRLVSSWIRHVLAKMGDYDSVDEALADLNATMAGISHENEAERLFPDLMDVVIDYFEKTDTKYISKTTGYPSLDHMLWWWREGCLYTLAARPAVGKSSYMLNLMMKLRDQSIPTAVVSVEMTAKEIQERAVCLLTKISMKDIEEASEDTQARIASKFSNVTLDSRCNIYKEGSLNPLKRIVAREVAIGTKVIFIDYLQLLRYNKFEGNMNQMVSKITYELKQMCIKYNIAIIILSQLNRSVKEHEEPDLHHLRDSWSIEQDSDVVMFLQSTLDTADNWTIMLHVKKNRHWSKGCFPLKFTPRFFCFDEYNWGRF